MNISGGIVVFVIIWWTIFFAVLPWGIKGQWENEQGRAQGTDPGAPIHPQLKPKMLRTTWITAILWGITFVVIKSGIFAYQQ